MRQEMLAMKKKYLAETATLLPIDAKMGQDVECYNTRSCCGDCDACPYYGQLAVFVCANMFRQVAG